MLDTLSSAKKRIYRTKCFISGEINALLKICYKTYFKGNLLLKS